MNRLAWWAAGASISLLVSVPVWVFSFEHEANVGSLEVLFDAKASVPEKSHTDGLRLSVQSGLLANQAIPVKRAEPIRLRIPAIGVDARIVPVGVAGGTTEVPVDVDEVGWYRFGGRLDESGSTLLVAHVSSGTQGPGVFFRLQELAPGDPVFVELRDGSSSGFRVIARRSYSKESLPDRLFTRMGPAVIALVTCGGPYSEATGRYANNVVVYAIPRR